MKQFFVLLCLSLLSIGTGQGLYHLKKGFTPRRIHVLERKASDNWNSGAAQALSQTYTYIGRGRQCFAFGSADGKYVVKLLRTDIYKLPLWLRALPFPSLREKMRTRQAQREQFIVNSMQIAFDDLQSQTGVLAVHLGQSPSKGQTLHLIDAMGCNLHLPLEKTAFVLQLKQPLLMHAFQAALQKGDRAEARKILDALLAAVIERGKKGILNKDPSFLRNYGYDGYRAYQIDVGSFFRMEDTPLHQSIHYTMNPIRSWMAKTDPEMLHYLNQQLAAALQNESCLK